MDPRRSSDVASPAAGMEAIEGCPGGAAGADRPGAGSAPSVQRMKGGGCERAHVRKQTIRLCEAAEACSQATHVREYEACEIPQQV